jgi:hypothetical protein
MADAFDAGWDIAKNIDPTRGYGAMYDPLESWLGRPPYRTPEEGEFETNFAIPASAVTDEMMAGGNMPGQGKPNMWVEALMRENEMLKNKVLELEFMLDGLMAGGGVLGVGGHMTDDAFADQGGRQDFLESEGVIDAIMRRYNMLDPSIPPSELRGIAGL